MHHSYNHWWNMYFLRKTYSTISLCWYAITVTWFTFTILMEKVYKFQKFENSSFHAEIYLTCIVIIIWSWKWSVKQDSLVVVTKPQIICRTTRSGKKNTSTVSNSVFCCYETRLVKTKFCLLTKLSHSGACGGGALGHGPPPQESKFYIRSTGTESEK